eukprot:GHVL01030623.1.p1 GENE.GHVL01030623.1~~GHVL01030623.1.p1  ORF type:complete len:310 (+),score=44.69 GHVL01030623.1:66-995(+)
MATSNLTFADWQSKTNASLMSAAEELLEKLEDTSDLLTEIDEKYIMSDKEDATDDYKTSMIQRFHAGLDSARNLVNVLKREKWRLSKREMSVELRMGELEDYKLHLKNDMSSLNQTVDALSMRVVQLENQLVEAQEVQENLEAELQEHRNSLHDANDRNIQLYTENEDLKKAVNDLKKSNVQKENNMLKDEVSVLTDENSKLKDMLREAEALSSPRVPPPRRKDTPAPAAPARLPSTKEKDDNLSKLTKEFLDELTSLELRERKAAAAKAASGGGGGSGSAAGATSSTGSAASSVTKLSHTIHLKAEDV